ncbi:cytochrome b5 [Panus rudis PR-1116 ss-1]|nr:cytochrome b5 [Panus rudis PR-1116 ss-1]
MNPQGETPSPQANLGPSEISLPEAAESTASGKEAGVSAPSSPWGGFPLKDEYPKVPDPVDKDRLVSTKQANRPFLAYRDYREKMENEHRGWLERKKQRDEKIARGEEVGPEEPDPTAEPEVGCLGLLKLVLIVLAIIVLTGKFFTGSFLWEQQLPDLRQFIPSNQRLFSERMLAQFDGTDESKPIYLAIDGDVYDVSAGRATYGPGGSYHIMAGKDAARAFATGCFATHQTHDLRGLSEKEMQGLRHWKKFYAESKKYPKVGRVIHPPIDPLSPIPEHCNSKRAESSGSQSASSQEKGSSESHEKEKRSEL